MGGPFGFWASYGNIGPAIDSPLIIGKCRAGMVKFAVCYPANNLCAKAIMNYRHHLFFFFCLLNGLSALAQGPPRGGVGGFGGLGSAGQRGGSSAVGEVTRDTSEIFYFFAGNPNEIFPFADSLLSDFQQYDPARRQTFDYAHLGNLGSAARPLFHESSFRQGFDLGLHQFDLYQKKTADVRFYEIEQAYTQAAHSQGQTQSDAFTNLRFSRNFANGVNLSLEYNKIDNLGAYDNQQAENTNVAFGLWFHNQYDTYDGFFTIVTNSVEQQDNGGITNGADTVLQDAFRLDVNLANSNTRFANREYAYTQYFYLNKIFNEDNSKRRAQNRKDRKAAKERKKEERRLAKLAARDSTTQDSSLLNPSLRDSLGLLDSLSLQTPRDTLTKTPREPSKASGNTPGRSGSKAPTQPPGSRRPNTSQGPPVQTNGAANPPGSLRPPGQQPALPEGRVFTLYHQMAWRTENYKFSALPADSSYFGDFWVDDRGLRHYLEARKLQNTVKLQTFKLRPSAPKTTGRSLPEESDLLEVGLVHTLHLIDQEPLPRSRVNNLFLTGSLRFSPNDYLRIQTFGHLGLAANAGDFRLGGDLFLNFKKIGSLRLEAVNQLSTPSLLPRQFYVSSQEIWNNDFGKTLETTLRGTYSLPFFDLSLQGAYHLVNNLVYFDTDGLARQNGSALSVLQLSLKKDFHSRLLHLENQVGVQESTSSTLRLPPFYSKHSLYIEGKIFKKAMLTRLGLDARLTTGYAPYNYQPLTGQFFLQNEQSLPFTPLLDAFLNFKVKTFRFFFKVENLLPYFTEQYYYQTASYPMPFGMSSGGMRLGVDWRLVD